VLLARLAGGIGAGVIAAAASAALAELAPPGHERRAATVATISNVGGLGAGVVVAAVAIQLGGADTGTVALVYTAYLVVVAVLAAGLLAVPETVSPRRPGGLTFQRPLLPADRGPRRAFGWAAAGALALGTAVYETGLLVVSLGLFVAGTVLAGVGFGLTFRRGMGVAQRVAEPDHRADQLATWFLCAYAGNVVPTLALGVAGQAWGGTAASAGIAALIVAGALTTGLGAAHARTAE
jgi:MFS family permease